MQACGVDFEVKGYLANAPHNVDEVIDKKYVCPQSIHSAWFSFASRS